MKLFRTVAAVSGLLACTAAAHASDVSDVAREMKLPVPVVDMVFRTVDGFYASADAPANRLSSGTMKELTLKAVKSRLGNMEDSQPGKSNESSAEERNAVYKAQVKTTRHETSESGECVDNTVTLIASEAQPVVRDGQFGFDSARPKVSSAAWKMTFCRSPINGGTDYSDWQVK